MTIKPIVYRALARNDVEGTLEFYRLGSGEAAALDFIDALERAYRHIARHPGSGSTRYAHELSLPGLRCWPLRRFPFLIFYIERDSEIDVWRILHNRRDIPTWMQE